MAKPTGNPFFEMDVSKMLAEYKVPGIDVDSFMASQRKNIEALTAANQAALEGFQAVARRQTELVRAAMEEASGALNDVIAAGAPEEKAAKQAEITKTAFEKAIANAKELAEMMAKSNGEAADIIARRVSESLDEIKAAIAKAKK